MAIRSLEELLADLVSKVNRLERRLSRRGGPGGITGEMKMWSGPAAPSGWILAQGQALSRADYPDLFALIGTTYGAGNGTTTFNLPDMRGRVPVGLDSSQTEFDQMGEKSGAKTHTLTTGQMPSHTHDSGSFTDGFAAHATSGGGGAFRAVFASGASGEAFYYRQPASQGSNQAHNNLQPYIVVQFIIKT
ncbi:minor tail protein [Microbacterium phage Jefe]|uniref:Minor tail protein n=1 Tax=Microbacterium phage Honeyfin TaxID=2871520 RepID=A0AAE8BW90_9CAUD|nr:minor tail protein [Microbacterium phage Honeyfin]QZD98976.1 minor tail protein [Microbacterium phage Honeyfin]WBF79188.1 minor tail protein [Microbacterium phage Jefe]